VTWMEFTKVLGPTILIFIGGVISWFIKSRYEELRVVEERLTDKRREVYSKLLEPYIRIFSDMSKEGQKEAQELILSYEYRKCFFDLILFGSDGVIEAYNDLMGYMYESEEGKSDNKRMFKFFGRLLLEIRRSVGNKKTKHGEIDMLKAMIKDYKTIV